MASLYVTEYHHAAVDQGRALPVGGGAPVARQLLNSWPQTSAAFNVNTHLIRVHCDAICSVLVSTPASGGVAAATSDSRMAASQTEYFGVDPGGFISVIANT